MVNALAHKVTVDDRMTVETVFQLRDALESLADHVHDELDETYVVERLAERLSDGSVAHSIRIRLAERV